MDKLINNKQQDDNGEIKASLVFQKTIFHWPLYVLLIFLSCFAAFLYLRYTKIVYTSNAKIYLKDEKKSNQPSDVLKELSLFSNDKVVENEMELIKSPILLKDVIEKKGFNIRYYVKGRVVNNEVYEKTPVKINILTDSAKVGNYFLDIDILGNQLEIKYQIKNNNYKINTRFDKEFSIAKDRFSISYNPVDDLGNTKGFFIGIDSIVPLAYRKASEVNTSLVNKQSSVIVVTYEDEVPKRTADLLNTLIDTYNQFTLNNKNQMSRNIIEFIETRLVTLGEELNLLERDVETFKKTRGIIEIQESSKLILDQIKEADQKLNEVNVQLSVFDQIQNYVNGPGTTPFAPVSGNIDPTLAAMINRYEDLLQQRRKLSLSVQANNPLQQNLSLQIEDSKKTIQNYIAGFRRNAIAEKSVFQRNVNQLEKTIGKIPGYEREYINIKRQQSVKEALYLYLLQKKEESAVSYASNINDNMVISPAYIPETPLKPKKALTFISFILTGIVLASILIFIKYNLNPKLIDKKLIEKVFGFPVIAEVINEEMKSRSTLIAFNTRSVLAEQILNLRSNLKFLLIGVNNSPVILLTSTISGEGKTFLSAQLGNSLALNQKKVVLIELDLRKPKLAKSLGIQNTSGISNYIAGIENFEDIIKKVPDHPDLYIIPSGPIPPNPVEIIESEKMNTLFKLLRERFDYIIVDTAPIGLVTDARSVARYIDCLLFVTRYNYTPKARLLEVAENIQNEVAFKKVGLIFNGIEQGSAYGGYSYGYYNYGYGYTSGRGKTLTSLIRELGHRLLLT